MALPTVPDERQQGAVKEQEALEANAPAPLEATPEQMDEEALAQAVAPVAQAAQQPPAEQQYATFNNPMMLLPPRINFPPPEEKTPVESNYDIGMLWQVLASSPSSDPTLRTIAKRLLGGE